jgi:hypothetical protein
MAAFQVITEEKSKSIVVKVRYTDRMGSKKHNPNPAGKEGLPVSLHPLSFDEAIEGLAQTKMPEAKEKPKAKPKKANS